MPSLLQFVPYTSRPANQSPSGPEPGKQRKPGITGVMLYVRGNIIQVLEGEEQVVQALFERIKLDHRHTQVALVLSRPVTERLFSS